MKLLKLLKLLILLLLPVFGSAQIKNDTVKIKAIVELPNGQPLIVKGYAIYKNTYDPDDIDYGIDGRKHAYIIRRLIKLINASKTETLKNVYDYKENTW